MSDLIIAIGDVHGCAQTLSMLLQKLTKKFSDSAQYVFLGDYIDRGPDSKKCVDILIEFGNEHDAVFLRGNHDLMLLNAYEQSDWNIWLQNGARSTLQSYDTTSENFMLPEQHYLFYKNTQLYFQTDDYFFVHGGLHPKLTIQENLDLEKDHEEFLWIRDHLKTSNRWEKTVVFGHTPTVKPIYRDNLIGIDTGCVYKEKGFGVLTAVLLPQEEFIQQNCIDL